MNAPLEVRAEDAFDVAAVHAWLSTKVEGLGDEPPHPHGIVLDVIS